MLALLPCSQNTLILEFDAVVIAVDIKKHNPHWEYSSIYRTSQRVDWFLDSSLNIDQSRWLLVGSLRVCRAWSLLACSVASDIDTGQNFLLDGSREILSSCFWLISGFLHTAVCARWYLCDISFMCMSLFSFQTLFWWTARECILDVETCLQAFHYSVWEAHACINEEN